MTRDKALKARVRLEKEISKQARRDQKRNQYTVVFPKFRSADSEKYKMIMEKYYNQWMRQNANHQYNA